MTSPAIFNRHAMDETYEIVDLMTTSPAVSEPPEPQNLIDSYLRHPQSDDLRPQKGWVNAYYITVGGKKLGPYYARRWKENGKLHKEYVAEEDVERVKAACQLYRERRRRQRLIGRQFETVAGNLNFLWRMVKRSIKGTLRPDEKEHLQRLETQGIKAPGRPPVRVPYRFMVPFGVKNKSSLKRAKKNLLTRLQLAITDRRYETQKAFQRPSKALAPG